LANILLAVKNGVGYIVALGGGEINVEAEAGVTNFLRVPILAAPQFLSLLVLFSRGRLGFGLLLRFAFI
jgi:hypothetical protein